MASSSPNSSSFFLRGESSSSPSAAWIWAWILPIWVAMPMSFTMPRHEPLEMDVPANSMHSWLCAAGGAASAAISLQGHTACPQLA